MATLNNNNRASLLAGLRTGGVRSSSLNVPHTAAPTGAFNVPRYPPQHYSNELTEEEEDQFLDLPQQPAFYSRNLPMTAAVDGPHNRFSQQQQQQANRGMNPNSVPFSPAFVPNMIPQNQMQIQMLQLEMMRIQALQNQQFQAGLLAQAQQLQQQQQQQQQMQSRERRISSTFQPPATAGPMTNSFDLRAATLGAQMRRANQADQLRSQLGIRSGSDDQVPMTASLGGRFGSRSASLNVAATQPKLEDSSYSEPPQTPGITTIISGGTSLGTGNATIVPSKSDAASSWRRGGNNNSVLGGNRAVSSPSVKITPPPNEDQRLSPPLANSIASPVTASGPRFRPQPLRFSPVVSQLFPAVAIDTADDESDSSGSSVKSTASNSSPTTPHSPSSNEMPLSPREEASKRLFEGLGIGRPVSATPSNHSAQQAPTASAISGHRMVSQPTRQPRGPPSGAEELGPKNFATRIRRKAIGGLEMLMGARERRELVEAY